MLDNNLSWRLAALLEVSGIQALHVRDLGLADAPDEQVLHAALQQERVLVTMDGDFATMLAASRAGLPSILWLRTQTHARPNAQAPLLVAAVRQHIGALRNGAVVVVTDAGARARKLPL